MPPQAHDLFYFSAIDPDILKRDLRRRLSCLASAGERRRCSRLGRTTEGSVAHRAATRYASAFWPTLESPDADATRDLGPLESSRRCCNIERMFWMG